MSLAPLEMVGGSLCERDDNFVELQPCSLIKLNLLIDFSTWLLQEKFAKQKANEARLEEDKKNLRMNLDDAENRVTRGELARRSLEGELQRLKLALNDKETENQVINLLFAGIENSLRHIPHALVGNSRF